MPQAITHILFPVIIVNLFRDYLVKDRHKFPLHYVLIAGIGGILPDFDIIIYYLLGFFSFELNELHRTFTHTLFFLGIFLLLGLITSKFKNRTLGKHHLRLNIIFYILAFGIFTHILLDSIFFEYTKPLYPLINSKLGLNLVSLLPSHWQVFSLPLMDGILFISWIIYLELKHKITNFI